MGNNKTRISTNKTYCNNIKNNDFDEYLDNNSAFVNDYDNDDISDNDQYDSISSDDNNKDNNKKSNSFINNNDSNNETIVSNKSKIGNKKGDLFVPLLTKLYKLIQQIEIG